MKTSFCRMAGSFVVALKELIEEFEARFQAQLKPKSGRRAPNLKQGEPVTGGVDVQEDTAEDTARPAPEASVSPVF